jgi:dTDP-4-amino-4,6-dideoxygalactose transaminase
VHYPVPCHVQPAFAAYATGSLPVAEAAAARILSLPLHPALTAAQVGDVCTVLGHVDA